MIPKSGNRFSEKDHAQLSRGRAPDMTTGTSTPTISTPSTTSAASSAKLRAFVVTFAAAGPIVYLISIAWNLPLVTYHPAIGRIDFGWTPARSGEGPAMYWYGWTLTALVST